jgi:hypothetical protein
MATNEIQVSGPTVYTVKFVQVELESEPQPELVDRLLRALPSWFGIESSIVEYVDAATRLPTLVARTDNGHDAGWTKLANRSGVELGGDGVSVAGKATVAQDATGPVFAGL